MQGKLDALVRTQAMQLFRQQGLHFTMQQVAEPLHISKKTIYTVYPSKEALLLDMVDHAFAEIHRCKQEILAGGGTLQEKLRVPRLCRLIWKATTNQSHCPKVYA